jgi:hypothetical protein
MRNRDELVERSFVHVLEPRGMRHIGFAAVKTATSDTLLQATILGC